MDKFFRYMPWIMLGSMVIVFILLSISFFDNDKLPNFRLSDVIYKTTESTIIPTGKMFIPSKRYYLVTRNGIEIRIDRDLYESILIEEK